MVHESPGILDQLARWVEGSLALGWAGLPAEHRSRGEQLAVRLADQGFAQSAHALDAVLAAEGRDVIEPLGRLLVVLELATEAWEIERFGLGRETSNADG